MARARNIKPGFFKNEALADLAFEYRLLFIGLWTLADRQGRLEDRPKKIRMELFPADDVDCEEGLQALAGASLIVRYAVQGIAYVWIPTFAEHQTPHPRELASTIPPYLGDTQAAPAKEANPFAGDAQAEPGTDPISTKAQASPSDVLNPSNLNPDVLNPESLKQHSPVAKHDAAKPSTVEPLSLEEAKLEGGPETPSAILASVCIANGIRANAFHPLLVEWAREGITVERLKEAIAKASQSKTGTIPVAYLDPILHDDSKPVDNSWLRDDDACVKFGQELGVIPRGGEEFPAYRHRIKDALSKRARSKVT